MFIVNYAFSSAINSNKFFEYQRRKIAEFANSVDLDEVAHDESPHLDYTVCHLVFEFLI